MAQEDSWAVLRAVLKEVMLFLSLEGFQALQGNILSSDLTAGLSLL